MGTRDQLERIHNLLYTNSKASQPQTISEELVRLTSFMLKQRRSEKDKSPDTLIKDFIKSDAKSSSRKDSIWASLHDSVRDEVVSSISNLSQVVGPDLMGDIYQTIVGRLMRGDLGQFFTPPTAIDCVFDAINVKSGDSIIDPACGTGGFGAGLYRSCLNYNRKGLDFVGLDKDPQMIKFASGAIGSLTELSANLIETDSLDIKANIKRGNYKLGEFDHAVTNPPFGSKIPVVNPNILSQYDLAHEWERTDDGSWLRTDKLMQEQDPQVLFLELLVNLIKPKGRIAIVLPEGLYGNANTGYIWSWLRSKCKITHLIDCPRTMFQPCTDVKSNITIAEKLGDRVRSTASKTWVGVIKSCGHDKRGRSLYDESGKLRNDFRRFSEAFKSSNPAPSREFFQIEESGLDNDFLVPRSYAVSFFEKEFDRSDFQVMSIGELEKKGIISISRGIEPGAKEYGQGDIPFIRTSDLANGEVTTNTSQTVSENALALFQKRLSLEAGNILLVSDGRYRIGQVAYLTKKTLNSVIQSHVKIIKVKKPEILPPELLFFLLRSEIVQEQFYDFAFVQSTIATVGPRLKKIILPIPKNSKIRSEIIASVRNTIIKRSELLDEWETLESKFSKWFESSDQKKQPNYSDFNRVNMPDIQA